MPIGTLQRIQSNEIPEYPIAPPFSGIQSEMSAADVEKVGGFVDCRNFMLWNCRARMRPGVVPLPGLTDPILGSATFFDLTGDRHQVAITQTGLYEFNSTTQTWVHKTGALTGNSDQLFSSDVVGYKLLFCQGVDNIQVWDGVSGTIGPVSPNSFPSKFLMELNGHLVAMNTVEGGQQFPQRLRWSGQNDPSDWTSFNAGINDLLDNLGPIYGGKKVSQQGLLIRADGVTQMIPTGIGIAPFEWFPLGSSEHGCGFPYSIAALSDIGCFYVAKDNVYLIDSGFNFIPIGSRPIDGGLRVGARTAILAELQKANVNTVNSFVCVAINGVDYLSYWLVIPGQSTWVYNISEGNWTRFTWGSTPVNVISKFYNSLEPTWASSVGIWSAQTATWESLDKINPFDLVFIGRSDGTTGQIDFSIYSEEDATIIGPQHSYQDRRHIKTFERFRIGYEDLGAFSGQCTFSTDFGYSTIVNFDGGTGTGLVKELVANATKISGVFHSWEVDVDAGVPASFTEFAPLYVTGGEFKNNP